MSATSPKVSIGLPVYNGAAYLAAAIDSLLAQTYTDIEVIVSDNGSTDRTEQIGREYAARDPRVRYFREPANRGMAWNFNRSFELARGKYFRWHAHDDLCAPTLIERCLDVLERDPEIVLCCGRQEVIDAHGKLLPDDPASWLVDAQSRGPIEEAFRGLDSPLPWRRYFGVLLKTVWCVELFGLMRSDIIARTRKMRPYVVSEKVFIAEIALHGRFHQLPETLVYVRRHAQQFSQKPSAALQRSIVNPRRFEIPLRLPRHIRPTFDCFRLALSAPISWAQRLACAGVVLRYLLQVSKWKRIIAGTLSDAGISGGAIGAPEAKNAAKSHSPIPTN